MPDYTPQPEQQQARLNAELNKARVGAAVERCGPATEGGLEWTTVGSDGTAFAVLGRYVVVPDGRGYRGQVFADGSDRPTLASRVYGTRLEARAWCEADADRRADLDQTKEHPPLVQYEMGDPIA